MPFYLVLGDITKLSADAIVNAANSSLLGGGGVDGAIHRAAGPELLAECRALGGCATGAAKMTGGYALPCRYVIHTVGPVWRGGTHGERALLASCYRASLALAEASGCASVAFPLISAGAYGYPEEEAFRVAEEEITAFLRTHEMTVTLVLYDRTGCDAASRRFDGLRAYFAAHLRPETPPRARRTPVTWERELCARSESTEKRLASAEVCASRSAPPPDLHLLDESFSQMLLRLIDEHGLTDAACYRRANIDRRLFSKIRADAGYRPSKQTALAFAVALELPLRETEELLRRAGYALSPCSMGDVIVEYFIRDGNFDLFAINEALFAYDQALLGG